MPFFVDSAYQSILSSEAMVLRWICFSNSSWEQAHLINFHFIFLCCCSYSSIRPIAPLYNASFFTFLKESFNRRKHPAFCKMFLGRKPFFSLKLSIQIHCIEINLVSYMIILRWVRLTFKTRTIFHEKERLFHVMQEWTS